MSDNCVVTTVHFNCTTTEIITEHTKGEPVSNDDILDQKKDRSTALTKTHEIIIKKMDKFEYQKLGGSNYEAWAIGKDYKTWSVQKFELQELLRANHLIKHLVVITCSESLAFVQSKVQTSQWFLND